MQGNLLGFLCVAESSRGSPQGERRTRVKSFQRDNAELFAQGFFGMFKEEGTDRR